MDEGNAMIQTNGPDRISKLRDSLIRKWLVKFAEVWEYSLRPTLIILWVEALSDLAPETIENACAKLLREWKPDFGRKFPVPGDIRDMIGKELQSRSEQEADQMWNRTLSAVMSQYHPDVGWRGLAFEEAISRAVQSAGGVHYLATCGEDQLTWARKRFMEAYLRNESLEKQNLLPPPELKQLLAATAAKKALPGDVG